MKIYFEDGELLLNPSIIDDYLAIDAKSGISSNINKLEMLKKHNPNCIIYTNSIVAFSNEYCWNTTLNLPELYIRQNTKNNFIRIDKLTERKLTRGHNLIKLYVANEFKK